MCGRPVWGAGQQMIRTKTVFVVGAGASAEFNFPVGGQLLTGIREALNFTFDISQEPKTGDRGLFKALKMAVADRDTGKADIERLNRLIRAGHRMRTSAVGGDSIDNVIDQMDDDIDAPTVGKLAIAYSILRAEAGSTLANSHQGQAPSLETLEDTWLFHMLRMLRTDVRRSAVDRIFEDVTVITFNYDRTIEHFLPLALSSAYNMPIEDAQEITKTLSVYHPYGLVGRLPWMVGNGPEGVSYGVLPLDRLGAIASEIRTFGERIDDEDRQLKQLRSAMDEAIHVVFLGFGFHRQNMRLLTSGTNANSKRIFATIHKMPVPAVDEARIMIKGLGRGQSMLLEPDVYVHGGQCKDLMSACFMPLTG